MENMENMENVDSGITSITLDEYTRKTRERLQRKLESNYSSVTRVIEDLSNPEYRGKALWERIREWIKARDLYSCRTCGTKRNDSECPLDVHHRNYDEDTLEGRNPDELITLCRKCHDKVEYFEPEKLNERECQKQKEEVLFEMLKVHRCELEAAKEEADKIHVLEERLVLELEEHKEHLVLVLQESDVRGAKHFSISFQKTKTLPFKVDLTSFCCDLLFFFCRNAGGSIRKLSRIKDPIYPAIERGVELPIHCESTKKLMLRLSLVNSEMIKVKLAKSASLNFDELYNRFVDEFDVLESVELIEK
jgi:hypothetical protein